MRRRQVHGSVEVVWRRLQHAFENAPRVVGTAGRGVDTAQIGPQLAVVRTIRAQTFELLQKTPEMKSQSLESLIRQRVIQAAVGKANLYTSDERLLRLFVADPELAFLRNPDGSVNQNALAAQGMSSDVFAERLRQDMTARQVMAGLSNSAFAAASVASSAMDAMFQQREVQVERFDPKDYLVKVNPTDADLEVFYKNPGNTAQFQAAEKASIEYLVLDLDSIMKSVSVPESELREFYDQNTARFYRSVSA